MITLNSTLIAQILNFVILVAILYAVAYKPVMRILAERTKRIQDSLDKADADQLEAEQTLADYKKQLAGARTKAQEIVDSAERRAAAEREQSIAQTKAEIEKMKADAQAEIARDRARAVAELKNEVVALSLAAAGKIVAKNIDTKDNEAIIAEFTSKLDKDKLGDASC